MDAPPAQFVKTKDGYDIAYYLAGEGLTFVRTPVFWTHISRQWAPDLLGPISEALAERFKLVLYDGRGQGLSSRGLADSLSLDDLVLDLEAVLNRMDAKRFVLCGSAFSGIIAIRYAEQHPERVEALILINYLDSHSRSDALLQLAMADWPYYIETAARIGWPEYDPKRITPILREAMSQSDHIRQLQAVRNVSGTELLGKVTVPTLILATQSDSCPIASVESAKKWAAMLPNSTLVLLEGPDFFGSLKGGVPEGVLAVADFLERITPPGQESEKRRSLDTPLSRRQIEVLRLVGAGQTNPDIAENLVISLRTVERHLSEIYAKIGARNRADAAIYALTHSLDT